MKKSIITGILSIGILGLTTIQGQNQYQVAGMQYDLGEYESAINTYKNIDLSSEEMDATELNKYADSYTMLNRIDRAINIYNISLEKDNQNNTAYLKLADLYRRVGDTESSLKVYDIYKNIDPVRAQHGINAIQWSKKNSSLNVINHELTNLSINSEKSEYFPTKYKDGIVFSSNSNRYNRVKDNQLNSKVCDQLYYFKDLTDNGLNNIEYLRSDIQDWTHNSAISFSPDNSWALITISNKSSITQHFSNSDKGMRIYIADVEADGNLSDLRAFPFNSMDYSNGLAYILDDGMTVLFSSNRKGGYGGYDIYYTRYENGKWSKAENMGKNINTAGNEISPSVYEDKMYFASDYHYGYGGFDIFGADIVYEDNHLVALNTPVNLGLGINSPSDEYSAAFIDDELFISSQRSSGIGRCDIFLVESIANDQPSIVPVSLKNRNITQISKRTPIVISKKEHYLSTSTSHKALTEIAWTPVQLSIADNLTPAEIKAVATDRSKVIKNIYSVQVAVVSALDNNEINRLNRTLGNIDQIYKIHFRNQIKIRVGSYDTNEEALRTLNLVRAKGYTDAFVVTEQVIVSSSDIPTEVEMPNEKTTKSPNITVEESSSHIPFHPIGQARYKVRLATYSNPKWFDKTKVINYGNIQRIDRADWTIFLLGDYDSIEKAESVRIKVIEAGFNQAQVVTLENGIPVKAKD